VSIALDIAIGLTFLYLSLALVVTTVQELIASIWRLRAGNLYDAIAGMLQSDKARDDELVRGLYNHPLIRNLSSHAAKLGKGGPDWRKTGLPSYIPSKTFALALIDVIRRKKSGTEAIGAANVLADAAAIVGTLPAGRLKESLTLLVGDAESLGATLDQRATLVSERIEGWFNDRMARASGWYKQRAQAISLAIAFAVTLACNADSIHVVDRLWHDGALRVSVVADAQRFVDTQSAGNGSTHPAGSGNPSADVAAAARKLAAQSQALQATTLPVGWQWLTPNALVPCARLEPPTLGETRPPNAKPVCWTPGIGRYLLLLAGWLTTALAVSLGANFWFDVLSRALQLRGSGPRVSVASGKVER